MREDSKYELASVGVTRDAVEIALIAADDQKFVIRMSRLTGERLADALDTGLAEIPGEEWPVRRQGP